MSFLQKRLQREIVPLIYPSIQGIQTQFANVLLIDNSVPDYQVFVDSVNSSTFPIVYSKSSSKTELLALLQTHFTSISRIGIAFTSELGNVKMFLDRKPLFLEKEVEPFSENTQFIIDIIKEFSVTNIDYLACNTLNYPNWTNYYKILTQNTGVVVGASNDKTGNMKYGGDWTMESTGQDIELIYFTKSIEYYTYLLDTVTATIPVGASPNCLVLNSSTNRLYVSNFDGNSVSVINTSTNTIVTTITVGLNPIDMILNSAGTVLYVANYSSSSVNVIDTAHNKVVVTRTVGSSPSSLTLNSSTNQLYITNHDSSNVSVISTLSHYSTLNITVGAFPSFSAINSSGTRLYVTNFNGNSVSVLNTSTNTIVTTITGFVNPYHLILNSSTDYLYVVNQGNNTVSVINTATNAIIGSAITVGITPGFVRLNSSTGYLYVNNLFDHSVSVIDTATNTLVTNIPVGDTPYNMVLRPSTNLLYVTNRISDNVSVIDTTTNTVVETIAVGDGPTGIVINSSLNVLYVVNGGTTTVSVITITPTPTTITPIVCFNKHTKILTDKGYKLIQDLRKGDLVKTMLHDYKPIDMIGFRDIHHPASKERIKDQLYKCSQMEYPEVFEPLIITGCHSILVDDFTSKEQRDKVIEINGNTYVTDNKYRIPACIDERASVYEVPGNYTIYHMALENDDYYENYGIFANGLLVESCSKRYLKELSNMTLIE